MEETKQGEYLEGFVVSGPFVKGLADKHFSIELPPLYREFANKKDPKAVDRKVLLTIKLSDGTLADFYPNKTSRDAIAAKCGPKLVNWIGFKGEFFTADQMIEGTLKSVIYVKAV